VRKNLIAPTIVLAQANCKLYIYLQLADGSLNPTPVIYLPQPRRTPGGLLL
jgi:hypothetical protein